MIIRRNRTISNGDRLIIFDCYGIMLPEIVRLVRSSNLLLSAICCSHKSQSYRILHRCRILCPINASRITLLKIDMQKGRCYDKGELPNRTVEQSAFPGARIAFTDLCCRRFVHFGFIRKEQPDRAFSHRRALLTGH